MIKWLGASVAAVGIACASAASADVVVFQQSGTARKVEWFPTSTTAGHYRLEFTTSIPISYWAEYYYFEHWDLVIAPGQPNEGAQLDGNSYMENGIRNATGTALSWDFIIPEDSHEDPYASPYEQYRYGSVPVGTMVQKETHIEYPTVFLWTEELEEGMFEYSLRFIRLSPVPEPATWAMLIGGFGLVGTALRSRRRALA